MPTCDIGLFTALLLCVVGPPPAAGPRSEAVGGGPGTNGRIQTEGQEPKLASDGTGGRMHWGQGVLGTPLRFVDSLILLDSLFGHPST